jgi:uncharacterized membrane protein
MTSKNMKAKTTDVIGIVLVVLCLVSFILYAIQKVRTGKGLEYYLTGQGVQMNYIGVLIALSVLAIALLVGWMIRAWSARRKMLFMKQSENPKTKNKSHT